ncbi:uncharacterized protein N7479_001365 [Penicillium vulpinum]|uniref:Right handed beta helix domain-containing protein n=1 Tax=Penicillium vulpinum TaxID=29845 RepID=A0A1V6RV06_9EURO|nr:uncharacterized protein N7479_001365 [Penicillium vulpinum]KAJ5971447.1 hypothetical protein N7479_001365 [Penicillium vulpinum]OQE05253.1 hypothetical protein PENVUL_c026G03097 [Penicillium vulpinum]
MNNDNTPFNGDGNTVTRSCLSNCIINNSCVKRSTLSECVISKTKNMSRITAEKSQFHDAALIERSDITDSIIQTQSSVCRSTIGKSIIQDKCTVNRSTLTGTTTSKSQLERATLTNCVITECTIERCDFQGLVLKYGIWERNELVGKTGRQDPVFIRNYGSRAGLSTSVVVGSTISSLDPKDNAQHAVPPPSYNVDSCASGDSGIDYGLDLPPPYRP